MTVGRRKKQEKSGKILYSPKLSLPLHLQTQSDGVIAQLVEQRTENPCVPGSIPGDTTLKRELQQCSSLFLLFLLLDFAPIYAICVNQHVNRGNYKSKCLVTTNSKGLVKNNLPHHSKMRKLETTVCRTACTVVWEVGKCESRRLTWTDP